MFVWLSVFFLHTVNTWLTCINTWAFFIAHSSWVCFVDQPDENQLNIRKEFLFFGYVMKLTQDNFRNIKFSWNACISQHRCFERRKGNIYWIQKCHIVPISSWSADQFARYFNPYMIAYTDIIVLFNDQLFFFHFSHDIHDPVWYLAVCKLVSYTWILQ
jgi:hypothetical protein